MFVVFCVFKVLCIRRRGGLYLDEGKKSISQLKDESEKRKEDREEKPLTFCIFDPYLHTLLLLFFVCLFTICRQVTHTHTYTHSVNQLN